MYPTRDARSLGGAILPRGRRSTLLGAALLTLLRLGGAANISNVSTSVTPLTVGSAFVASWFYTDDNGDLPTTGDLRVYEITLEPCAGATGDTCECASDGNALATSLCDASAVGCVDSDGSFDLTVPSSVAPGVYLVRVSLQEDPISTFACSAGFSVEEEEEESPGLSVTSTTSGNGVTTGATLTALEVDAAPPGAAVTARWLYDDGEGEEEEVAYGSPGDFAVDLYTCENGACDDGR